MQDGEASSREFRFESLVARQAIRQNRWGSEVIVPLGKPVTIFSSDDLSSKRKMQIELTATPITP